MWNFAQLSVAYSLLRAQCAGVWLVILLFLSLCGLGLIISLQIVGSCGYCVTL